MYNTRVWCVCVTTVTAEEQPASCVMFGCMSLSTDVTAQQCIPFVTVSSHETM
jgi:hypothetical protein